MTSSVKTYNETGHDEIRAVLFGRRIVKAELGQFDLPSQTDSWRTSAEGRLTLDDGTVLYVVGNDGGCSCGAGDYELVSVAEAPNVITRVEFEDEPDGDDERGQHEGHYSIYVWAENQQIRAAHFEGSDGNGYYGTGYQIHVVQSRDECRGGVL